MTPSQCRAVSTTCPTRNIASTVGSSTRAADSSFPARSSQAASRSSSSVAADPMNCPDNGTTYTGSPQLTADEAAAVVQEVVRRWAATDLTLAQRRGQPRQV